MSNRLNHIRPKKSRPRYQQGTMLKMKRQKIRNYLLMTMSSESRNLYELESLYTDGSKHPRTGEILVFPNELKAYFFRAARENLVKKAQRLQAEQ